MTANDFTRSLEVMLANMPPTEVLQLLGAYNTLAAPIREETFSYWREVQREQLRPQH
ncbi:MAG: hypothetical protein AAGA46_10545 [Cyanobacteria bacterium P01_F01_bin.13]